MNKLIIDFMKSLDADERKKYFCEEPSEKTIGKPIPSPRSWELVSNILDLKLDNIIMLEMIKGAVGKDAAQRLIHYKNSLEHVSIDDLFNKNKAIVFSNLSMKSLSNLCTDLRTVIKTDFVGYNVNDIYTTVGNFLLYLISNAPSLVILIANDISVNKFNTKFKLILELYERDTGIDIPKKIIMEALNNENI